MLADRPNVELYLLAAALLIAHALDDMVPCLSLDLIGATRLELVKLALVELLGLTLHDLLNGEES